MNPTKSPLPGDTGKGAESIVTGNLGGDTPTNTPRGLRGFQHDTPSDMVKALLALPAGWADGALVAGYSGAEPGAETVPPLVSCPYGQPRGGQGVSELPYLAQVLTVGEWGLRKARQPLPDGVEAAPAEQPEHLRGVKRGKIEGFSERAARRCREAVLSLWSPGMIPAAITLTSRKELTPEEWRAAVKRFRTHVVDVLKVGMIWRVELQRRGVPHLHVVAWLPAEWVVEGRDTPSGWEPVGTGIIRDAWLRAIRAEDCWRSRKHGVHLRAIDGGAGSGWACYLAMHHGKHKAEQLGWIGKQWGVWGREHLVERPAVDSIMLTPAGCVELNRRLRRWSRGRYWKAFGGLVRPWGWIRWDRGFLQAFSALQSAQLLRGIPAVGRDDPPGEPDAVAGGAAGGRLPLQRLTAAAALPPRGPLRDLWSLWGAPLLAGERGSRGRLRA